MKTIPNSPTVALTFSILSACGSSSDPSLADREVIDGVEVVSHQRLPQASRPRHFPEYLVKVEPKSAGPQADFGEIGGVELLTDGSLAVLDRFSSEIRIFSPKGRFLRAFGREGAGPGELSGPNTLCLLRLGSDRLVVPDIGNARIAVFNSSGEPQNPFPFDISRSYIPEWRAVSGDSLLVRVSTIEQDFFVRMRLEDAARDTLLVQTAVFAGPSPIDNRWPLLADQPLWSVASTGEFAIGRLSAPEFRLHWENGEVERIVRWSPGDRELGEEEILTLLRIVSRSMGDPTGNPAAARSIMAEPSMNHAIADLEIGPRNLVLVQRLRPFSQMDARILSTAGASGFGGPEWDVFLRTGEYLGVLDFGQNVEVIRIAGDTIIGYGEGELGVAKPFLALLPRSLAGPH